MTTTMNRSTPPPPSSLHTPQTPRFGFDDDYQPYSPRKSSRVSAQRSRITRTPPPQLPRSRKTANTSPSSSPPTAAKKVTPQPSPSMGGRKVSGALSAQSAASAAASLGLPTPEPRRKMDQSSATAARNTSLLPTPNKTPKKRTDPSAGLNAVARNLFSIRPEPADEMPTPKKGRKKYKGFTMDSFEVEEDGQPIQIYTDSHDRVPELDTSTSNPFYGSTSTAPEPSKRASKRRKINVPGEGDLPAEEVEQRKDGLVYVFRGKKVFRKFADDGSEGQGDAEDSGTAQTVAPDLRRPLTRSSIAPRLLFPTADQKHAKEKRSQASEDDEEAITDIEEHRGSMEVDEVAVTPKPAKFAPLAPATPPTSVRTLRSKKIDLEALDSDDDAMVESPTHIDSGRAARVSPYDNFTRTKAQTVGKPSKKREGSSLSRDAKKIRG